MHNPHPRDKTPPTCHPRAARKLTRCRRRDQNSPRPLPPPQFRCQMRSPGAMPQHPASYSAPACGPLPTTRRATKLGTRPHRANTASPSPATLEAVPRVLALIGSRTLSSALLQQGFYRNAPAACTGTQRSNVTRLSPWHVAQPQLRALAATQHWGHLRALGRRALPARRTRLPNPPAPAHGGFALLQSPSASPHALRRLSVLSHMKKRSHTHPRNNQFLQSRRLDG